MDLSRSTPECVDLVIVERLCFWALEFSTRSVKMVWGVKGALKNAWYHAVFRKACTFTGKDSKLTKHTYLDFLRFSRACLLGTNRTKMWILILSSKRNVKPLFVEAGPAVPGTGASLERDGPARQSALPRKSLLFHLISFFRVSLFWVFGLLEGKIAEAASNQDVVFWY